MTTLSARNPRGIRAESVRKTYRIPLSSKQPASQPAKQPSRDVGTTPRDRYRFLSGDGRETPGIGDGIGAIA